MPLLPVDLQTLFGQTAQVGREQAVLKEGVPLAQAVQAGTIASRAVQEDASVVEPRQAEEGPEQARIRERGRRQRPGSPPDRRQRRRAPVASRPGDPIRDPALGRHVDLSG